MSTDRPGAASRPFTVDAEHIQIETGLLSYSRDHWSPDASLTRSTTLFSPDVKLGLTNWADLDVVIPVSNSTVTRTPIRFDQLSRTSAQGFGSNMVEFTLVAPYSFNLPYGFSMTVQPCVGLLRNGQKKGMHPVRAAASAMPLVRSEVAMPSWQL